MRYLQTQMSINENEKILTWTRMCCVLCCVRTCWLADAFPADVDECKQKRKRYLPDGGRGCVAFIRVGVIYLCGCVWTCWLADALPADADEYKQKRKKYTYLMVDADVLQCVRTRMEGRCGL